MELDHGQRVELAVIPMPADFPIEIAAQLSNAITAWDLLQELGIKAGQCLAVTAA